MHLYLKIYVYTVIMDLETLKTRLENDKIENIVLQFYNILGETKELYLNVTRLDQELLDVGYSNRDLQIMFGDQIYLKPIQDTYTIIPWYIFSARFVSRIMNLDGEYYETDMLVGLEKVVESLKEYGVELLIQPAIEYYIIENASIDRVMKDKGPVINIDTREGKWNNRMIAQNENLFSSYPADAYNNIRKQLVDNLRMFNHDVEAHYHSNAISQHKIILDHRDPIHAALAIADMKYISQAMSSILGVNISYMPYLFPYQKGNSLEIRITGNFKDKKENFVAGILDHLPSLMIFTNPNINSYRRLINEGFYICYSNTRTIGVAIEIDQGGINLLFPDSSAHPFLSITAILAAGLDGIKKGMGLEYEVSTSPKLMSIKDLKEKKIEKVPNSLESVLENFQSDKSYLKDFIDSTIITEYLNIKQQQLKDYTFFNSSIEYEQSL